MWDTQVLSSCSPLLSDCFARRACESLDRWQLLPDFPAEGVLPSLLVLWSETLQVKKNRLGFHISSHLAVHSLNAILFKYWSGGRDSQLEDRVRGSAGELTGIWSLLGVTWLAGKMCHYCKLSSILFLKRKKYIFALFRCHYNLSYWNCYLV